MDTISISLPLDLQAFVKQQTSQGGFRSVDAYIGELIRLDHERKHKAWLEAEVLKGLESGPATDMTAEDWAEIRREVQERLATAVQK